MTQTGTPQPAAPDAGSGGDVLSVTGLEVVYNDVIRVLHGVSLHVPEGEIVAILGANGAGKTTLLRAITGLLPHHRGEIVKGRVTLAGRDITGRSPAEIVEGGVAQVMEGRHTFAELSVDDNLRAGAVTVKDRDLVKQRYERAMELFPVLRDRRSATAGYLSGGEQQMLVIARALMSGPRVMLLDEPSLGLAPMLVEQIAHIVRGLNTEDGTSILLVEQNASMALHLADHGYVMETGRIVRDAPADALLHDEDIRDFYLGGHTGQRSFRDVKTYRRRRRWA